MPRLGLILSLMLFSSSAFGENWQPVLKVPGLTIDVDRDTVTTVGPLVSGWQRWIYDQEQIFNDFHYRTGKHLIYTDCVKNTRANAHVVLLDDKGVIVYSRRSPVFGFAPLLPNTLPEDVHKLICASR